MCYHWTAAQAFTLLLHRLYLIILTAATGVTAPEEFGGLDMGYQAHCIAMEVRQFVLLNVRGSAVHTATAAIVVASWHDVDWESNT